MSLLKNPFKKKVDTEKLKEDVIEALRGIYDPEIPVNIYELGLIYNVEAFADGKCHYHHDVNHTKLPCC